MIGIFATGVAGAPAAVESFESRPAGGFESLASPLGRWSAPAGHAAIHDEYARNGSQSLHLCGGAGREMVLALAEPMAAAGELRFWAERWTGRAPFSFRIDARERSGDWREVYNGDAAIRVGGFHVEVGVALDPGVAALRFRSTTPPNSGLLIDALAIGPARPLGAVRADAIQPVVPVLVGKPDNPVVGLRVQVAGGLSGARQLTGLKVTLAGTTRLRDVRTVRVLRGGPDGPDGRAGRFGKDAAPRDEIVFKDQHPLAAGDNWLWLCVELVETADLDGHIDAAVTAIKLDDGSIHEVGEDGPTAGALRIARALRRRGDDASQAYRIPGLATTTKGTLIAVYDIRRRGGSDLPGDIDVGMSRSTDGGQSWEPMRVIMDMGDDPKWNYDGIGDPAVLVDKTNNRTWVAAVWSHGNISWNTSGKGMNPEQTFQLMMVRSDDDGRTWSQPINVTGQLKDPDWRLLAQGPGRGITLRDGTLVFAAQFRAGNGAPHSTMIHSKDHGKSWTIGAGVKGNTTEAQVVELGDGALMINCRDNRGGARTIATTTDLGRTWTLHPTDRKALIEPVCMASLLRIEHPRSGPMLLFSNPNTRNGRRKMTLKVSTDEGMTWPTERHTLYDMRPGCGYSCLSPVGEDHVGLLYEGMFELYFLRFPIAELMGGRPGE